MKIFAYEHSGMGSDGSKMPPSAARLRCDIMLQALLADLIRTPNVEVGIIRSLSAPPLHAPSCIDIRYVDTADTEAAVSKSIRQADAVWLLAPESDGLLARLSEEVLAENRILIGCRPDAVALTASKHATSVALAAAGLPVVRTYRLGDVLPQEVGAWVVKPDDGAGCTDTHLFPDSAAALTWVAEHRQQHYILQPFVQGRHCSLSLICSSTEILMLSLNDQRMVVSNNELHHMGSTVNNIGDPDSRLAALARGVVAAIPGLWGYVGIDFIMGASGPVILEVNPRMTTSHAGLHESVGCNPTELVIDLARGGPCRVPPTGRVRPISVDLNTFHDKSGSARPSGLMY